MFGLRVEAMCPPTEGKAPGDLRPGERMGALPMGRQGARGYRVGHAEEPHTGMHTHAYEYRETVGAPPWLTGLNACHKGIGYTRGDPPAIIQWMGE